MLMRALSKSKDTKKFKLTQMYIAFPSDYWRLGAVGYLTRVFHCI